jgi:hypothetical protein
MAQCENSPNLVTLVWLHLELKTQIEIYSEGSLRVESRSQCYDQNFRPIFTSGQGPMLGFIKYFRRKIQQKKLAFLTRNKVKLCKNLIITLVFEKNANFFAENNRKSLKIVIITSTPAYWHSS